jgi:hypothetical protein
MLGVTAAGHAGPEYGNIFPDFLTPTDQFFLLTLGIKHVTNAKKR